MNKFIFSAALCLSALSGCTKGSEEAMLPGTRAWNVYKGNVKVLVVRGQPGPLISAAVAPSGTTPPRHPFLTGNALDISEEDSLRGILDKAENFDDFLARLRQNGYRVEPQ